MTRGNKEDDNAGIWQLLRFRAELLSHNISLVQIHLFTVNQSFIFRIGEVSHQINI